MSNTTDKLTRYQINQQKSKQTQYNHTVIHILYNTIKQQCHELVGGIVSIEYTHPYKGELCIQYTGTHALTPDQLLSIQSTVNSIINNNIDVSSIINDCNEQHTAALSELKSFYILKTKRRANKNQYDIAYVVGDHAIELIQKQQISTDNNVDTVSNQLSHTSITNNKPMNPLFANWVVCGNNLPNTESIQLIQLTLHQLHRYSTNGTLDLNNAELMNKLTTQLTDKYESRLNMYQNVSYTNGYIAGTTNVDVSKAEQIKRM